MGESNVRVESLTPILRIFDEEKAKQFYLGFLEFQLDWEHRFEVDFPLYMQVSYGPCVIHLSEHHGDCTPGAALRIEVRGIQELHAKVLSKRYNYARPGLETAPWGGLEIRVADPFGNRLTFYQKD
ncbi:catechol 2,3-dioxygenase-like lactoylglutathione lyase family enzyme [Paenibacillus mucilaginosus]|uniref:glyoxalase superfamily protein n=1 Tax=Paenibacillus mucilaginosus TaxID=61624 RepID=UPI003D19BF35